MTNKLNLSSLDQNGYYNKTINECKLKLYIPLKIINEIIYPKLYEKNEVAGVFHIDQNDIIHDVDINEGDEGSVYTPNNIINYHTHPINAYRNAKTAFGSPSGEDYRETLKFALAGNKAHLVFTVEGLYIIQVSPCKIKKIKELLNNTERGILIFLIEEYFKTTHNFRCTDELNQLAEKDIMINPYSFDDFANTFDIINLLETQKRIFKTSKDLFINKTGHTGIHSKKNKQMGEYVSKIPQKFSKIPNMGCPEVEDNCIKTTPLKNYLTKDDLNNLRSINAMGQEESIGKKNISELLDKLKKINLNFNNVPCNIEWNSNPNTWFFVNFFPTQHYIDGRHHNGKKFIIPEIKAQGLYLEQEPFIRIFSNTKDGCNVQNIAKTHEFKMKSKTFNKATFHIKNPKHKISSFGKRKKQTMLTLKELNNDILFLKK